MLLTPEHMQVDRQRQGRHAVRAAQLSRTPCASCSNGREAEGRIPDDPTAGVTREKVKTTGYKTWSEAEIERFESTHPIGSKARLAFALLLYTGQRRGDVVKLGRQHVHDDVLIIDQGKTEGGEEAHLEIPCIPSWREIIDGDADGRRQDVPGHAFRQALHRAGFRQLVPRTVRRRRLPGCVGARPAQGDRSPARRDRMQRAPDRRHHRPCDAQ